MKFKNIHIPLRGMSLINLSWQKKYSEKKQGGFSLVEVLISVALMSIVAVGFLTALSTAPKTIVTTDEQETAKNIAEMQMEHIRELPYAGNYSPMPMPAEYAGYSVATDGGVIYAQNITDHVTGQIQEIAITIKRDNREIYTLTAYKAQ